MSFLIDTQITPLLFINKVSRVFTEFHCDLLYLGLKLPKPLKAGICWPRKYPVGTSSNYILNLAKTSHNG